MTIAIREYIVLGGGGYPGQVDGGCLIGGQIKKALKDETTEGGGGAIWKGGEKGYTIHSSLHSTIDRQIH